MIHFFNVFYSEWKHFSALKQEEERDGYQQHLRRVSIPDSNLSSNCSSVESTCHLVHCLIKALIRVKQFNI